ncbi:mitochondrial inner-membrane-bound regulator-domain-containing protein [Hypoxylon rubiginosum]|uniref:Mitochondrial inner-membrane-bound regulator-domain-containing protein n=1 Tax=Hypoxylon rubiginosum TaxID=110542 RepID=A0ACC0D9F7_9PEZI|nr:mitochondrial inner-membrane-bound regulator-domain-containing protein [Hypoxylon rubiginosum]
MIAASVSGGAVCLRCRLRLLRQSTQPFQASNRNRIFKVRQPSLRCFASESTARFDVEPISEGGHNESFDGQAKTQDKKVRDNKEHGFRRSKGRKRLSGGRVLSEGIEGLGSEILGKPGHVIVMRDQGLFRKKNQLLAPESAQDESVSRPTIDIEALLDNQRRAPTAEEVRENINGLRPKTETTLPERAFRKLQTLLTDGFLSVQLMAYLEYHKKHGSSREIPQANAELVKAADEAPQYDWIRSISPWIPLGDQQSIADGTDPNLYGYVTDSATAKTKLAVRILRECWGLSIAELSAGLGETRVKIRNSEFLLLMRGTQRWVNAMGKIWLGPDEKIEAFRNKKTLRLVTTKTKASVLIRSLDETLKQITTKTFPVQLVTSEPIDEAVLEELGRMTDTHIRISPTYNRLHVTWIEAKTRASRGLEDTREAVLRLLLTALKPKLVSSSLSVMGFIDGREGRFITDTTSKEKLGWKDRMGQWARYMLPLAPEEGASGAANPLRKLPLPVESQTGVMSGRASDFDENKDFLPETQFPAHPVKWAEDVKTATVAHFGYLLHANDPKTPPPSMPRLLNANHPRVFAPVTPHPVHLAKFEMSDKSALLQPKTTVVVHFWPSPISSISPSKPGSSKKKKSHTPQASSTPPAPILELRLATAGGQVTGVESLRAVKKTHVTDVMVPASPIDLRFTQTQYTPLEGAPANLATWQPIADFLKPARLDVASSTTLEVPPHQRFPIPRRLFSIPLASVDSDPHSEVISTLYTFVGLEVHRAVSIPYERCRLTYTSVDGGRGGSRRAEVSLEPASGENGGSHVEIDAGKLQDDFLAACQKLAGIDNLWSNYPTIRKLTSEPKI